MLAYRHGFHAGNAGDVLKHVALLATLEHLQAKPKGLRIIDTHAGGGGYRLPAVGPRGGEPEWSFGVGRLWERDPADAAPAAVERWLAQVRGFNGPGALQRYPGSPRLLRAVMRPQDELKLAELHPAEHTQLAQSFAGDAAVRVERTDGFQALPAWLPPPTRRALVLMDPAYEMKQDYGLVLRSVRAALERFAEAVVVVWYPQVALREAAELPQRLKATAQSQARKGWLHARLTWGRADAQGFGMVGAGVLVLNPPHTLHALLEPTLPWLTERLAQRPDASWVLESAEA